MILTLLSSLTILISCNSSTNSNVTKNNSINENDKKQIEKVEIDLEIKNGSNSEVKKQIDLRGSDFVKGLKNGENLSSFFNANWIFIYHEDNRCDGSTDGQIDNLKSIQVDTIIRLQVKNDGDGWACDKKASKTYDLDFDLKKKIANWDRFEMPHYDNQEENIVYIVGAGESDYLILHYDNNDLIIKLEYRSEDPG